MTFQLSTYTDIEIPIPNSKGEIITLTLPPIDCLTPAQIDAVEAEMDKVPEDTLPVRNPRKSSHAHTRFFLCHFNPGKEKHDAIWGLVGRHVEEVAAYWNKESGITLGESEPSTDSSSAKTE